MASLEDILRARAGQPVEEAAQRVGKSADEEIDRLRKKVLEQVAAGRQYIPSVNPFNGNVPQAPKYTPEELEQMHKTEQGLHNEAMMKGPEIMSTAAEKLRNQAAIDQAAEQHANELSNPTDLSGYSDYKLKPKVQGNFDDSPNLSWTPEKGKFQKLQQQIQNPSPDDEEQTNIRGSTRDTGTYGGI